ncbi:MAG: adenylate/guanylate cyclase domain-containing protein [Deltaproteobacteria bacterium]|nr:adenylate/guanylate cyclase domain-containing protein [Deltaproteobacteria bacterium]
MNMELRDRKQKRRGPKRETITCPVKPESPPELAQAYTFLPGLVEHYLARQDLPTIKELAVLFVDLADSTKTILRQPPERALATVQRFMEVVTEVALAHCGDVKDYEGDGALLYFASITQAARAALAIRSILVKEPFTTESVPQARLSLNVGEVVIGVIGSPRRRSVALLGPAISIAARLLKQIPPGGIIAPQTAIEKLQKEAPYIAEQFQVWSECLTLKGFEEECVTAYHLPAQVAFAPEKGLPCPQQFMAGSSSDNTQIALSKPFPAKELMQ